MAFNPLPIQLDYVWNGVLVISLYKVPTEAASVKHGYVLSTIRGEAHCTRTSYFRGVRQERRVLRIQVAPGNLLTVLRATMGATPMTMLRGRKGYMKTL